MKKTKYLALLGLMALLLCQCFPSESPSPQHTSENPNMISSTIRLDLAEAERLASLPLSCIQQPLPYKPGHVIAKESDLQMPIVHHPAFYGCFDWHSAVHGHWSLIYLLKKFPELSQSKEARRMLEENLSAENILKEVEYFSLNKNTKTFERTYGWAWLLKLCEELYTWDDPQAQAWYSNLQPLAKYISDGYQSYLPKLVYPIRVGEHSNTAFGLSFAYDYAVMVGDKALKDTIEKSAMRFYKKDKGCPIDWEPSGYDFLSPCLQELDIMRKVMPEQAFSEWSSAFLPGLFDQSTKLAPGKIRDRSDGKLVHLDGLNFSRAWCLYTLTENQYCQQIADAHMAHSLKNIVDGDYAGQHWLASFALYAFKCQDK